MNRFLKGFLVFIVINVIGAIVSMVIPIIGFLFFPISIIAGVIVAAGSSSTPSGPIAQPKATQHGTPTFSWKGIDVYRDQGFLTFHGRRYELSQIHKISYETSGHQGCMGGTHYTIHLHTKDINTPRLTITAGNVTRGGNQEVERNYERLQIAMGFHG